MRSPCDSSVTSSQWGGVRNQSATRRTTRFPSLSLIVRFPNLISKNVAPHFPQYQSHHKRVPGLGNKTRKWARPGVGGRSELCFPLRLFSIFITWKMIVPTVVCCTSVFVFPMEGGCQLFLTAAPIAPAAPLSRPDPSEPGSCVAI